MSKTNERPSRRGADMQPRAILYLRQSTFREESISLELQETAGRDHAKKHGYRVIAVEADPGISGRTWKRPAVLRVMEAIETGAADIVVLWRWSRLSRSRKDWALAVDRIETAGGRIESATEPNDITASGRFARGVMTELAAFESERIGEQWKEVHASRISKGLPSGRVPWGWQIIDKQLVAHPDQASAIRPLYDLYFAGAGGPQLAKWLEANGYLTYYGGTSWYASTVTQLLESPVHSGQIVHNGKTTAGAHDGLVSVETFNRYKALRAERIGERVVPRTYLLSGLLRCRCGAPMFGFTIQNGKRAKNPYYGYRCAIGVRNSKDHGPATIATKFVDPHVFQWLESVGVGGDPTGHGQVAIQQATTQKLIRDMVTVDTQMSRLTQQFAALVVPERAYTVAIAEMQTRYDRLQQALQEVQSRALLAPQRPHDDARNLVNAWPTASVQTKRAGFRALVSNMVVDLSAGRNLTISPRWGSPVVIAL